jgi:KDO2-lipid IV(A) lauroyltransferase
MSALFRFLARCPLPLLHRLGALLGWISYAFSASYRQRLRAHVQQAGLPASVRRQAVAHAGRMLSELPWLWMREAHSTLGERVQVVGGELYEAAHAEGRGVLLLTPHLGCFEVTAQLIAERFAPRLGPITVLYRPARKAWLREWVDTSRNRPGLQAVPATLAGVRQMIRALKRGESVGLLPDQVPPEGMGAWAPFFGRPAYTMTLAAKLVQQTGAQALLIWGERLPQGRGFVVRFEALPQALPGPQQSSTPEQGAALINQAMEHLIRQCPGQYLWGYSRYKTPRTVPPAAPDEASAAASGTTREAR